MGSMPSPQLNDLDQPDVQATSETTYSESRASGDERYTNRYGKTPHKSEKENVTYMCSGNLKNGDPWGCGRTYTDAAALYRHFQHQSYDCIRPLLLEEGLAEHNQKATASGHSTSESHREQKEEKSTHSRTSELDYTSDNVPENPSDGSITLQMRGQSPRSLPETLDDHTAKELSRQISRYLVSRSGAHIWGQAAMARLGNTNFLSSLESALTNYSKALLNPGRLRPIRADDTLIEEVIGHALRETSEYIPLDFCRAINLNPSDSEPAPVCSHAGAANALEGQSETGLSEFIGPTSLEDSNHYLHLVRSSLKIPETLFSNNIFESLSWVVRDGLYSNSRSFINLAEVEVKKRRGFSDYGRVGLIIQTNLSLLNYIKHNFPKKQVDLSTLVTITGTAFYSYATTCLDYLKNTWPFDENILLPILQEAIQKALDRPDSTVTVDSTCPRPFGAPALAISAELCPDGTLTIHAKGPENAITVMVQQLSWLVATFSMPQPSEEGPTYCTPILGSINGQAQNEEILKLDTSFTKLHVNENRACWLSLFSPAVIAHGFPIPKRDNNIGLEMPIELMAAIIGARHAVRFDGGVVIKGFSSMFLPVMRTNHWIQWHYVANRNPDEQLSYDKGVKRCRNRALLSNIRLDALTNHRCFIGWNSLVEIRVGSETTKFYNIGYSDTKEVKSTLQIPSASIGLQQFALAQVNVTFGKRDGKCHFQRGSSYRRLISASERMFIVLFDTGERRGYLVTASGLLLHILRHRMLLGIGGVPATKVKIDSVGNITETLLQNAKLRISSGEDEPLLLDDAVSEIWSILELLQAQSISTKTNAPLEIPSTWHERLLGYEYMALAEDRSPMPLKQLEIRKTCGGWPRLARHIDALVLLANGFGDLIRPIDNESVLCQQWECLPRHMDYVAVPVKILQDLYSSAGCRETKKRLTSTDLQLHGEGASFQPCPTPTECQCLCDRLHQVISNSSFGQICVPEITGDNGAVIIGDARSFSKRFAMRSTPKIAGIPVLANADSETSTNRNSDISCPSESSDFHHSNTISPASSNDDSPHSPDAVGGIRETFRKILAKRKQSQSETMDSTAIHSSTGVIRPAKRRVTGPLSNSVPQHTELEHTRNR
ncbi:hypothetical protein GGR51DRAFT_562433 [Nemania sp. FL0031]|nr:hypothetical protein GGR51DRAFT_562433 [Nemania sp. FL0031]